MSTDADEVAADRIEERGFTYLSKVLRGDARAPDWLYRLLIDGPNAQDNAVMLLRANAEKYRRALQEYDAELQQRLDNVDYAGIERRVRAASLRRRRSTNSD